MDEFAQTRLRPHVAGILLALFSILLGWSLGGLFGVNEDVLKNRLQGNADAVLATAYAGDAAQAKAVVGKSWSYMKRAHLHWGVIGASSLAMILLLALLGETSLLARVVSALLGAGACGYGLLWLWAAFRAPGLGGTDAAKVSLEWLAIPSAGALLVGLTATLVLTGWSLLGRASGA